MKNNLLRGLTALTLSAALAGLSTSCTKDLDQAPRFETTPDKVYVDLAGYKSVLGKLYGGFALTGQQGAAGAGDIGGIDEGTSDYLRQLWSAQELTTDEAVVAWNDPGIQDWHNLNWDANNPLIRGLYNRFYYEIAICNEFIRESADDKLAARLSGADVEQAKVFRAEARFLRAVSYYHVLENFGNGPFVTETSGVGFKAPPYATRPELFSFVEQELLALDPLLPAPRANEYGRVDKAAAWGMLARLYLNAEKVYSLPARYTDAAAQAKKVIDAGFALTTTAPVGSVASPYSLNFLADNNSNGSRNEVIWPIVFDATRTQSFGGTTFLINGATGASAGWQRRVGQTVGWQGLRTTRNLFNLFQTNGDTARDTRGRFWTDGQTLEIADITQFSQGLGVIKYRNVTTTGVAQGGAQNHSGVDFPMIRLSELMLTYAEAVLRGGTGDRNLALTYVNQIRARAFRNATGSAITGAQLTTNFILDERARELFWEGYRRTDLIRYDRFVEGTYLWPWKGGTASGRGVDGFRKLFPIPNSDLSANPNLRQNAGY